MLNLWEKHICIYYRLELLGIAAKKNLLFIVGIITKKWAGYLFKTRMGAGICGGACEYPSRL